MNGTIRTIGALLIATATGAAIAQTAPDPQQTQPSAQTSPSPSTPPTHPSLRSAPTTTPDNTANSAATPRKRGGSLAEALQACRNMASDTEQRDCMRKAEEDFKKSNPSGMASPQAPQ